jgi:hypothetical protein
MPTWVVVDDETGYPVVGCDKLKYAKAIIKIHKMEESWHIIRYEGYEYADIIDDPPHLTPTLVPIYAEYKKNLLNYKVVN